MTEDKAKKLVIFSAITVIGLGWMHSMIPSKKNPTPGPPPINFFIQVGILFFFLSALADFKPKIGGWFAVLITTTSVFQNAPDFLNYVTGLGTSVNAKKAGNQAARAAVSQVVTGPPVPKLPPHVRTRTHPAWPPPSTGTTAKPIR